MVGVFDGGKGGDVSGGFAVKRVFLQAIIVVSRYFESLIELSSVFDPSPESGKQVEKGFERKDCAEEEEEEDAAEGGGGVEKARRR